VLFVISTHTSLMFVDIVKNNIPDKM